jgi:hypothetical protein
MGCNTDGVLVCVRSSCLCHLLRFVVIGYFQLPSLNNVVKYMIVFAYTRCEVYFCKPVLVLISLLKLVYEYDVVVGITYKNFFITKESKECRKCRECRQIRKVPTKNLVEKFPECLHFLH